MMKRFLIFPTLLGILLSACQPGSQPRISEKNNQLILENEWIRFVFHPETGKYTIWQAGQKKPAIQDAVFRINDQRSDEPFQSRTWEEETTQNAFGTGRSLLLRISGSGHPEMLFLVTLYENQPFIEFGASVTNTLGEDLQITEICAMEDAQLFPGQPLSQDFAMVDGFSGGEPLEYGQRKYSPLTRRNALKSRNNILLTFSGKDQRNTLVMGGLTYADYEKFAFIEQRRRDELTLGTDGQESLLTYLNLPLEKTDHSPDGEGMELLHGFQSRNWQYHEFHCSESATTAQDPEKIVVELTALKKGQPYYLGFSWWRSLWHGDRKDHYQTVLLEFERDGQQIQIPWFENELIPRFDGRRKEQIEQIEMPLPQEAVDAGTLRVIVQHGDQKDRADQQVYLSEIWLRDAHFASLYPAAFTSVDSVELPRRAFTARLFATDPVGKKVKPQQTYTSPDKFYLAMNQADPFEALEQYGKAVQTAQSIDLPMYDFPTVCLWYVEVDFYGGGMAENTSTGAVKEMEHIKKSGFLNYSRAAVRLVPDSYMPNNQQGWWDDEHWAKPVEKHNGSLNGRYTEPFETSEKWGKAVTELGGIPLTYFQTSFRSEDYAKTFPEHMLFNKTYAWKGAAQDTTGPLFTDWNQTWGRNGRVWGYDYSDPGFIRHLEEVYANLKKGGIKGLMFDYPASGWAKGGGLENPEWTAANAYRNIFRLASEGLGPNAYVHERNMERGTDISIGTVASMRTENDTDRMDGATVTRCGLRWYKNRVLYNQDTDSKNLVRLEGHPDAVRAVITMAYVTTGRLLLANSFAQMSPQTIHDLSRSFPYHIEHQSARPVDAFVNELPQVYDYIISDDWHQVTLYNPDFEHPDEVTVRMSGDPVTGSLDLDPQAVYYVYDFWNDQLAGEFSGKSKLEQTLRPGEARMLSIRKKKDHPQVISTNRHLMQGYLDLENVQWNPETRVLTGSCDVIAGDPFIITIAANGMEVVPDEHTTAGNGFIRLLLEADQNKMMEWSVFFK